MAVAFQQNLLKEFNMAPSKPKKKENDEFLVKPPVLTLGNTNDSYVMFKKDKNLGLNHFHQSLLKNQNGKKFSRSPTKERIAPSHVLFAKMYLELARKYC